MKKKDKKPAKGDLPPWLITEDSGSRGANIVTETKGQKQKDEWLLDNWPSAGIPDLPTVLDDEKSASPKTGGRPRSKNLPFPDLDESSGRSTPNRMQEIEQKRNEWKRKEQFKLEESWTSLNLFDRLQKEDVLDEYLSPEKSKPSEPTIQEEETVTVKVASTVDENLFEIPELPLGREMNYNKSRIHSYRGAKDIEITLDGQLIFKGETILFTTEEDILELVSQHDQAFEMDTIVDNDVEEDELRPRTADEANSVERPFTSAARGHQQKVSQGNKPQAVIEDDTLILKGQNLRLNFTDTWGDPYYLGLTGLEVVGPDGSSIPLSIDMVDADPRDLHVLSGYETDDRTLDKLLDGAKTVHVTLDNCQVSPPEGFLLRKGPGNCFFDFAQEVSFTEPQTPRSIVTKPRQIKPSDSLVLDEASQEYEVIQKPCGFIYQFQLLSTWGDPYYVGLNGLEFYDSEGNLVQLEENNISAYPESVNVLEGMENDTRTPDKLIDGENDTTDGRHMWLAPVLPNILLVDDLLVYNGLLEMTELGHGILPTCDGPQRYHTILFTDNKEIQRREQHTIIKKQVGTQDVQLMNDREVVAAYSNPATRKTKTVDQSKRPKTSVPGWGRKR
ncbi:hypothetical protein LSH36_543g06017 [Paralvinella palmiformis]|uniref:KATNIP domain-containing protein n=1 Tax=Paralvinella palmiformis TaxID=53620 RepID=A0AAD9J854_9ANNE|nr:hypothetical protein LSH36_543g06017 [Paralvinella palmiformis]